jgi:putative DNA primase/helicase
MRYANEPDPFGIGRLRRLDPEAPAAHPRGDAPKGNGTASRADQKRRRRPRNNAPIVTEDTAALEFGERYRGQLLFDHKAAKWFRWDGSRWVIEEKQLAFHWARVLARQLTPGGPGRFITSKMSFAAAIERAARADPVFAVTPDAWDRDPWLLGTPDGTVDLRSGALRPAKPEDRITKVAAATPTPTAVCPRWLQFLDEATGGNADLIRFLQQYCGYCLTGSTREHALIFIHGGGGEGKTTFVNAISSVMGDYAKAAAMETFTAAKYDRHPTEIARLHGARLVHTSETESGRPWAESRIKHLTGGDPVTAHFMRQDDFTFTPAFKMIIIGNHRPRLKNVDDAMRRRLNMVPFARKPPNPDPNLEEKLRQEHPGILKWMIEGCLDWQRYDLIRPAAVSEATEAYFKDQDVLGQWIEDECDLEPDNFNKFEMANTLFRSWQRYASAAGVNPGTSAEFSDTLQNRGVEKRRTKNGQTYRGITLRQVENQPGVGRCMPAH